MSFLESQHSRVAPKKNGRKTRIFHLLLFGSLQHEKCAVCHTENILIFPLEATQHSLLAVKIRFLVDGFRLETNRNVMISTRVISLAENLSRLPNGN